MSVNLFDKAETEKLYLTDNLEVGRTVPVIDERGNRYTGFVKTTVGEHKVPGNNKVIHELLMSGREISKEEYDTYSFGCQHSWRDSWLKNSVVTRKITYCVVCNEVKKSD